MDDPEPLLPTEEVGTQCSKCLVKKRLGRVRILWIIFLPDEMCLIAAFSVSLSPHTALLQADVNYEGQEDLSSEFGQRFYPHGFRRQVRGQDVPPWC